MSLEMSNAQLRTLLGNRHSSYLYVFATSIQAKLATSISPSFENSQLKTRSPFAHLSTPVVEAHFLVFSGEYSGWRKEIGRGQAVARSVTIYRGGQRPATKAPSTLAVSRVLCLCRHAPALSMGSLSNPHIVLTVYLCFFFSTSVSQ